MSTLQEAAQAQEEEARGFIAGKYPRFHFCLIVVCRNSSLFPRSELKKAVADETAAKEAVNTALTAAHDEYAELEQTAVAVCGELEGEGPYLVVRWPAACDRWAVGSPSMPRAPSASASNEPSPWLRHTTTWTSGWCLDTHHTPLSLLHSLHSL